MMKGRPALVAGRGNRLTGARVGGLRPVNVNQDARRSAGSAAFVAVRRLLRWATASTQTHRSEHWLARQSHQPYSCTDFLHQLARTWSQSLKSPTPFKLLARKSLCASISRGSYLLATVDGQPAGCVTLKPVDQNRCELKRLYVRPTFRGHNLGKQLVDAFTQTARTLGFQYAVLDSHKSMTAAHDIYKNSGFKVVKSPPDFPEALKQSVIFMRCVL